MGPSQIFDLNSQRRLSESNTQMQDLAGRKARLDKKSCFNFNSNFLLRLSRIDSDGAKNKEQSDFDLKNYSIRV